MSEEQAKPSFTPGTNIALKVPEHEFEATVRFYRDVIGLQPLADPGGAVGFDFGGKRLWIDRVPQLSHAEVWLELRCDDVAAAAAYLDRHGVVRRDGVEPLPEGFPGFWVSSPANVIHLVCNDS